MSDMTFDYLSWEAFATLLTGVLAVGAAYWIGQRQTGIASTQTSIQKEQAEIQREQAEIQREQLALQAQLAELEKFKFRQIMFDARYEVYQASRTWLVATIQNGIPPAKTPDLAPEVRAVELEQANKFTAAIDRSRFLFRPEVREELWKMWKAGNEIVFRKRAMERNLVSQAELEKHADGEHEAFAYLVEILEDLSKVFGDELTLTQHAPTFTTMPTADERLEPGQAQ